MKEYKDHLNIDLEFLDKKESPRTTPKPNSSSGQGPGVTTQARVGGQYNWKNIFIIGGVILFFGWVIFSEDSSSSSSTANTYNAPVSGQQSNTDDNLVIGQYSCSRYHYDQAVALDPDESEQQIEIARTALESRSNEIDRLQSKIKNSYVNEYSDQWEIDEYNELIDDYNKKLSSYKTDSASFETRIDRYNVQIEKHNNYLTANCTKRY